MKYAIALALSLLILAGCSKKEKETEGTPAKAEVAVQAYKNEPDGYNGIKWGTTIDSLTGMGYYTTNKSYPDINYYTRKGEILSFGKAQLSIVLYSFWQKRFCELIILCKGFENWTGLREAIFEEFGKGEQPDTSIEKYVWHGSTNGTGINLEYNAFSGIGTLNMFSNRIGMQQSKSPGQKTKPGAGK